jgi:hypothetical protein
VGERGRERERLIDWPGICCLHDVIILVEIPYPINQNGLIFRPWCIKWPPPTCYLKPSTQCKKDDINSWFIFAKPLKILHT